MIKISIRTVKVVANYSLHIIKASDIIGKLHNNLLGRFLLETLMPKHIGKLLNHRWQVGASHALYDKDGKWYHRLTRFPGVLCDPFGYVLFNTPSEFLRCSWLKIGEEVHVSGHISDIPTYVRVPESDRYRG